MGFGGRDCDHIGTGILKGYQAGLYNFSPGNVTTHRIQCNWQVTFNLKSFCCFVTREFLILSSLVVWHSALFFYLDNTCNTFNRLTIFQKTWCEYHDNHLEHVSRLYLPLLSILQLFSNYHQLFGFQLMRFSSEQETELNRKSWVPI